MSQPATLFDTLGVVCAYIAGVVSKTYLSPGGSYAIASLLSALVLATIVLLARRRPSRRRVSLKVLRRALLPRRILSHPSSRTDLGLMAFNVFVFGLLFGWAMVAARSIGGGLETMLVGAFGALPETTLAAPIAMGLMTLALFLAYELGYYIDHYLAHRVPFLWEFHKVHHAAEVLTPFTNSRVHPVDTIVFYNISAVVMGLAGGLMHYVLGRKVGHFTVFDENAIAFVFAYSISHLQHSHVWIAFTGLWGRIFLSPAHHQIHHSTNPIHFDRNFGSSLSVFDWLFGTLHLPQKKREKLNFGVDGPAADPHSVADSLVTPVVMALQLLKPRVAEGASTAAGAKPGA